MTGVWLLIAASLAARPTAGGTYGFDPTDVVERWDEPSGRVRVHYSVDGPNVTRLDDDDADGVPDFAEEVALTAAEVLDFYVTLGLRPPIAEAELGLGDLGGSGAFDFYLVDFAGIGDGQFGVDACTDAPYHCAGYMVMENDFAGYGYPSLSAAIRVLTSHELFHAVQAAYDAGQPSWFSEGTAVWAEQQFDPESDDFRWFCDAYLEDAGRSLDQPPTGPTPSFSYGTALFWDFLTLRHGQPLMHELLLGTEAADGAPVDTIAEIEATLEAEGAALEDTWTTFAQWNLATGRRAGAMESYPYAGDLVGISAEVDGAEGFVDDDNRFYPLATTYFLIDHDGGPLWFGIEDDAPEVRFSLHPVEGGAWDGPVEAALAEWDGAAGEAFSLGELERGGYWLVGSKGMIAPESTKVRFCIGPQSVAERCAPPVVEPPPAEQEPTGCGCATGPGGGLGGFALAALAALGRRRSVVR